MLRVRPTAACCLILAMSTHSAAAQVPAEPAAARRLTVVVLPFVMAAPAPRDEPVRHRRRESVFTPPSRPLPTGPVFTPIGDRGTLAGPGARLFDAKPRGRREADDAPPSAPELPTLPAGADSASGVSVAVADLLVRQLLESGRYRLLDARQLEALRRAERERDDRLSSRARRRDSAAAEPPVSKPGTIYLLQGSITRFGTDERGIGGAGGMRGVLGALGLRRRETQVGLTARLVDAATGEVVASVRAIGRSRKGTSAAVGGLGGGLGGIVAAGGTASVSAYSQATERSVRALSAELARATERLTVSGGMGGAPQRDGP